MSQNTIQMSSLVDPARRHARVLGLTPTAWLQILIVTALMAALFRFNLWRLWGKTNPIYGEDSNWQHSVFVPLIGIYYLYIHRDELLRAMGAKVQRERTIRHFALIGIAVLGVMAVGMLQSTGGATFLAPLFLALALIGGLLLCALVPTSNVLGTVVMLGGLLVFAYGIYPGQNDYIKDVGMVMTVFGVITLLAGWEVMKIAWFPIAFLVVAIPWPELVYSKLAWPLQKLAASAAVGTLRLFGVEAHNFGTKIEMLGKDGIRTLNVAEACAGLRSLMTFLMVAGTVAFLSSRPLWEKLVQTAMAIPIAILCNVVRVAGQGLLDFYVSQELSQNFAHQFVGLIMLIPGFFLILLVGWLMDKMFIDEVDLQRLKKNRAARGTRNIIEIPRKPRPAPELGDEGLASTEGLDPGLAASELAQPGTIPADITPADDADIQVHGPMPVPSTAQLAPDLSAAVDATDPANADVQRLVLPDAPAPVEPSEASPVNPPASTPTRKPAPVRPPATQSPAAARPAAAPRPATTPPARPAASQGMAIPSGLKPSAPRTAPASLVPVPPASLKPSAAKPATAPGGTPGGLLPSPVKSRPAPVASQSTLKPSAPKPAAPPATQAATKAASTASPRPAAAKPAAAPPSSAARPAAAPGAKPVARPAPRPAAPPVPPVSPAASEPTSPEQGNP